MRLKKKKEINRGVGMPLRTKDKAILLASVGVGIPHKDINIVTVQYQASIFQIKNQTTNLAIKNLTLPIQA